MIASCIYSIDILTNTNESFNISSDNFDHFYIASIDGNGDETSYIRTQDECFNANFFMLRILNSKNINNVIERLYKKPDIINISINFTDGTSEKFNLPIDRKMNNKKLINSFEYINIKDNNLCILVTDKQIKYKESLFE